MKCQNVEDQKSTLLFVDEFTEAGLFQQLKATAGSKAIVGKEEVSQLFDNLLQNTKEKSRLDVERLIQLYDGAPWTYTKADKSARQVKFRFLVRKYHSQENYGKMKGIGAFVFHKDNSLKLTFCGIEAHELLLENGIFWKLPLLEKNG